MSRCGSIRGKNKCCLQDGHDLPHTDHWDGHGGSTWTEGDEPAKDSVPTRDELVSQLVEAAGELVRSVIYEDPHARPVHAPGNALYCSGCNRYGIVGRPIEHAASCVAGKVSSLITQLRGLRSVPAPWDDYWYGPVGQPSAKSLEAMRSDRERIFTDLRSISAPTPKPELHIEYEVEEHPWASEEGNAPPVRELEELNEDCRCGPDGQICAACEALNTTRKSQQGLPLRHVISMTHEEAARRASGLEAGAQA